MSEQKAQSNQAPKTAQKARKPRPEVRVGRGKRFDATELQAYLDTLSVGVVPSIHFNGTIHPTAIIAVDFGAPISPVRLSQDQVQELMTKMRKVTRDLYSNEVNIRVSSDHQNGIFWASIA